MKIVSHLVFVLTPLAANGNAAAHLNFTVTPRHVKDKWDSIFSEFIDLRVQASLGNSPRSHTWIHCLAMERMYNIVPEGPSSTGGQICTVDASDAQCHRIAQ